jgi:hypothetical protein
MVEISAELIFLIGCFTGAVGVAAILAIAMILYGLKITREKGKQFGADVKKELKKSAEKKAEDR